MILRGPEDMEVYEAMRASIPPTRGEPLAGRVYNKWRFVSNEHYERVDVLEAVDVATEQTRLLVLFDGANDAQDWASRWRSSYAPRPGQIDLVDVDPVAFVLQRPRGDRLSTLVAGLGWADELLAVPILRALLDVVGAWHEAGFVHGEINLETVWGDGAGVVVLPPLRLETLRSTDPEAPAASPDEVRFLAPEQTTRLEERVPATDVWQIGLLAFELLTGKPYWLALASEDVHLHRLFREMLLDPIVPPSQRAHALAAPTLPAWFDAWFLRCVARDRAERFTDARTARRALDAALGSSITSRTSVSSTPDSQRITPYIPPSVESMRLAGAPANVSVVHRVVDHVVDDGASTRKPARFRALALVLIACVVVAACVFALVLRAHR